MRPITNARGQYCGYVDNKIYYTRRDKSKGEIFIKKNWFYGKYIHKPIAIDKSILNMLIRNKIQKIVVTLIGDGKTRNIEFNSDDINKEGMEICYDKRNVYGQNFTGFSKQIVFDVCDGKVLEPYQKKLILTP